MRTILDSWRTTLAGALTAAATLWQDPSVKGAVHALLIALLGALATDAAATRKGAAATLGANAVPPVKPLFGGKP